VEGENPMEFKLGRWVVDAAVSGKLKTLPVTNEHLNIVVDESATEVGDEVEWTLKVLLDER